MTGTMNQSSDKQRGGRATDWKQRARKLEHKPNPVDVIPEELYSLGKVFFPIPRAQKGWNYPHHIEDFRYKPDSEKLNAYLEAGFGYGIVCANDLAVVDIDDLTYIEYVTSALPETVYQKTGSGEGYHLFYHCPGLNTRINLSVTPTETAHTDAEGLNGVGRNDTHIGEVKCDPHGYVIGPESIHPSGGTYGPLRGRTIASITKETLTTALAPIRHTTRHTRREIDPSKAYTDVSRSRHKLYNLEATDVTPWMSPGDRVAHPVHGSDTNSNFMMNEDGQTYTCWRCKAGTGEGCGVNPEQLLSMVHQGNSVGEYACESVRAEWSSDPRLHYYAWREAFCRRLVPRVDIPYNVLLGFGLDEGLIKSDDELSGSMYTELLTVFDYYTRHRWD